MRTESFLNWRTERSPYPQNLIIDIHFDAPRETPEADHETLIHIPGVIDTGFFFNLAGRVVVGFADGQVIVKP